MQIIQAADLHNTRCRGSFVSGIIELISCCPSANRPTVLFYLRSDLHSPVCPVPTGAAAAMKSPDWRYVHGAVLCVTGQSVHACVCVCVCVV